MSVFAQYEIIKAACMKIIQEIMLNKMLKMTYSISQPVYPQIYCVQPNCNRTKWTGCVQKRENATSKPTCAVNY